MKKNLALLGLTCLAWFYWTASAAQTLVDAEVSAVSLDSAAALKSPFPAPLAMATSPTASLTAAQIAALTSERFTSFEPNATQLIARDQPIWLRLRIHANPSASLQWVLEMPSVVVDRYEIYQQDASGVWQMQTAGDYVAHNQWPVKSLRPRFTLQAAGSAERVVLIRVVHLMPSQIAPLLMHEEAATHRDLSQFLLIALLIGLFSVLILLCLQMALTYRDATYFWYACYLLATLLTAVAYSGIGQYFIWPQATKFASDALVCFELTAFAFNLKFVRAMFASRIGAIHGWVTRLLMGSCMAYVVHILLGAEYADTVLLPMSIVCASCIFILGTAVVAWRKRIPYSGYWLLIYGPFLTSIALASLENAGLISLPWLPKDLPLLTVMFEAMAMTFCLNAFSRASHAQTVREQALAQRDPLTGFLNEAHFMQFAANAWSQQKRSSDEMTLAYVLVEPTQAHLSTVQIEEMLAQSARRIRVAMRENDVFGRIGQNILGIAMPNVAPGEALNARLSRLVTWSANSDTSQPIEHAAELTLAAATWRVTPHNFATIDQSLRSLVHKDMPSGPRTIRFLEP